MLKSRPRRRVSAYRPVWPDSKTAASRISNPLKAERRTRVIVDSPGRMNNFTMRAQVHDPA